MHKIKLRGIAPQIDAKDKLSIEELVKLSRLEYLSEPDLCKAFHSVDNNTPKKIMEFLFNQSIILGRSDHAFGICHFLDSKITKYQASQIVENAIKRGRTAQAIDAAILDISEKTLDKLISHLANHNHIWIIYEYEKMISGNEQNKFSNEEKDFYLNLIEKVKEAAVLRLKAVANKSNKKNIFFIIKEWVKKFF